MKCFIIAHNYGSGQVSVGPLDQARLPGQMAFIRRSSSLARVTANTRREGGHIHHIMAGRHDTHHTGQCHETSNDDDDDCHHCVKSCPQHSG